MGDIKEGQLLSFTKYYRQLDGKEVEGKEIETKFEFKELLGFKNAIANISIDLVYFNLKPTCTATKRDAVDISKGRTLVDFNIDYETGGSEDSQIFNNALTFVKQNDIPGVARDTINFMLNLSPHNETKIRLSLRPKYEGCGEVVSADVKILLHYEPTSSEFDCGCDL